ncbi:hypothetical protein COO60DRAFT_890617 [Scenedesmus sp. NREL 46B-D3]|nr:hypothetical protein COO60DRAFT_890617 [Scenedesmus sp. NREL 46B-D3]
MQACHCRPLGLPLRQVEHKPARAGVRRMPPTMQLQVLVASSRTTGKQRSEVQQQPGSDAAGREQLAQPKLLRAAPDQGPSVQQQQQQLTGYVAEPWEVTESWEVAEQQQQQQQQQQLNRQQVGDSWRVSRQHLPEQQGSLARTAVFEADEVHEGSDNVWLLDEDADAEIQQVDEDKDKADMYYIAEADEAEQEQQQLWQGGRQLMQDMQRAMQPPLELQQLHQQQQQQQQAAQSQPSPSSSSTNDMQRHGSWPWQQQDPCWPVTMCVTMCSGRLA